MSLDGGTLDRLYAMIASRRGADPATSYTARLFADGPAKIAKKLGEEAVETVIEGVRGDGARLVAESADLLYHLLVLWADRGVTPDEVWRALEARAGTSGIDEKKSRSPRGSTDGL
ncbi:MAG TPA: phosphoribosyl-ATP diphosphatase [Stellaceae bacterium]|jgi:phosphoribosyl-ATP pyrophosphohydrolase|nr:phosphoribosyl-ATP diphosphatase [Stellaceae bacterium]